jgi:hypothetical protein
MAFDIVEETDEGPSQPVNRPRGRGRPPDRRESIGMDDQTKVLLIWA